MRVSILDLGSNSFRLLVADVAATAAPTGCAPEWAIAPTGC